MSAVQNIKNLIGVPSFSTAAERFRVLRTDKGRLFRVLASNLSTGALFLQVHDKTTLAGGEVPKFTVPIPALGFGSLQDIQCTSGCVVALSTTAATYTDPGLNGWFYGETG